MKAVHKPGPLKQQNKSHKHGRHRSNRSLENLHKGKVGVKGISKKQRRDMKKVERRNQVQQIRRHKREEVLNKKRSLGTQNSAPFAVAIVSLQSCCDPWEFLEKLKNCDEDAIVTFSPSGNCHISVPRYKQRFMFFVPEPGNIFAQLDAAKVADTIVLIHHIEPEEESDSKIILTSLMGHGLPSLLHVLQGLDSLPVKKRADARKLFLKDLEHKLPVSKLHCLEQPQDALLLIHQIGSQKKMPLTFRDRRPHLLAEAVEFKETEPESEYGTLIVHGYVRGQPLNVNNLVHLPGGGSFQLLRIESPRDPFPLILGRRNAQNQVDEMDGSSRLLCECDPAKQDSLESENIPDQMENEQTWPSAEELAEAEADLKKHKKRVPKGTSDYQAAWILESEDDGSGDDDEDEDNSEMEAEDQALEAADGPVSAESDDDEDSQQNSDNESDMMSTTDGDNVGYDDNINEEEERKTYVRFQEERMNEMFPDEVDTPKDKLARIRYARYRGLKSFHSSPWDTNENLPPEYSRIFQFENFNRTKKKVLAEEQDGVLIGWFVSLHIANVPREYFESHKTSTHPLVVYGQLPHEQKMSVVNCVIKRHSSCLEPIKSKERLIFHVGYRRFSVQPIFSSHTTGNKHKYERFLKTEEAVVASFYAPLVFGPAPVLVYKECFDGSVTLVATGSLLSVDPTRLVAKRIVLSGHPFKINRKSAVVRYMFFDRDDIVWFKPVELHTKYGRRGHIKEPLGTHGHMKCVFDGQLKSQDTVLMNLYKRVFPKWTYDPNVEAPVSVFHTTMKE